MIEDGRFLEMVKEATDKDFCSQIRRLSKTLRRKYNPEGLVVVVPGPVVDGTLLKAPPLGITKPLNVKEELSDLCADVIIENDMNAAVMGELNYGFGKKHKNFYLLTISTGIGAGIVIDGKVIGGTSGEFGHNILEREAEMAMKCGCGNYGCWVAQAAGIGVANLTERLLEKRMSAEEFFKIERKDKNSKRIISMMRDYNAQGIGMMINALPMEAIIVMGSIGLKQFDKVMPNADEIKKYTVNPIPKISRTELGDEIGLLGAYAIGEKWKQH